jgi:hypothetical protein
VNRVFSSSTAGLLAVAAALAIWEVSGIIRAAIGRCDVLVAFAFELIVLLVAMELDELVRADAQRPRAKQNLLPLVAGVIRGVAPG